MSKLKQVLLVAVLITLVAGPAVHAGWLHFSSSLLQASQAVEKHPGKTTQFIIMPKAAETPSACVGYTNNLPGGGKGKVTTTVTVMPADGSEEKAFKLVGRVRKNSALKCVPLKSDLAPGDAVFFDSRTTGFKKLRKSSAGINFVEIAAMISAGEEPTLGQKAPLGFVPADGPTPFGLLPQAGGTWFKSARSLLVADKKTQKHPGTLNRKIPVDSDLGKVDVCVSYNNNSDAVNKGKVVASGELVYADETTESLKFIGPVRRNEFLVCKQPEKNVGSGAVFTFSAEFKGMKALKQSGDVAGFANVNFSVSTSGEPEFREPPAPPPTPGPNPPPNNNPPPSGPTTPPPGGGNGISAADEAAVARLYSNKPVQLWRPKGNSPGKWVVVGPKTRATGQGNGLDYRTAGVGGSPSAALADYDRKMGKLGGGGSLSAAERSMIAWYSSIDSSQGPTSIRRAGTGTYFGEYYRPGKGVHHKGFGSLLAALNWLKSQGL